MAWRIFGKKHEYSVYMSAWGGNPGSASPCTAARCHSGSCCAWLAPHPLIGVAVAVFGPGSAELDRCVWVEEARSAPCWLCYHCFFPTLHFRTTMELSVITFGVLLFFAQTIKPPTGTPVGVMSWPGDASTYPCPQPQQLWSKSGLQILWAYCGLLGGALLGQGSVIRYTFIHVREGFSREEDSHP